MRTTSRTGQIGARRSTARDRMSQTPPDPEGRTSTVIRKVWDEHPDEAYRRDQSHYRGVGRFADDEAWLAIGRASLRRCRELWRMLDRPKAGLSDLVVLEWGPGGGSNAYGLQEIWSHYYGVDISKKNLDETQRVLAEGEGKGVFHPLLLEAAPATVTRGVAHGVDLFLSTAVFQHFPSRDYGREVLGAIRQMCKPGAAGFIQIRFDNGAAKYRGIADIAEYESRHIYANSYPIDGFWDLCRETGFRPLYVGSIGTKNNYATFFLTAD